MPQPTLQELRDLLFRWKTAASSPSGDDECDAASALAERDAANAVEALLDGPAGEFPPHMLDRLIRAAGELWHSTGGHDPYDVLSAPEREALDLAAAVHEARLNREMGASADRPGHDETADELTRADRFSLDKEKARAWLGRIVAAYPDDADGISEEAPAISAAWQSRSDGAEWTAERLVRGATEDGILICPDGMSVYFVYECDGDGGSYHFTVDIGHDVMTQVSLNTWGYEMRKLGDPDTTGIEAALSILEEAVSYSNKALANLALLPAAQDTEHATANTGTHHQTTVGDEVNRLAGLANSLGVSEPDLDECVHDLASTPASDINNSGLACQIAYLVREAGSAGAERMIREAVPAGGNEENRA